MDEMAREIENALKTDFPNARLKHAPHPSPGNGEPKAPATSRQRIGNTIEELTALVADLNTLIATLATIRDRL